MGQHDLSYRLFFSHARMVCDLLCELIGEEWIRLIDFATAERGNSSFVSARRRNRESDIIWRFRRRDTGEPVYVYILLEFQSKPDRYMPVRMMTYMGLFFEYLIAKRLLPKSGKLPLVIPVVIYNGIGPWGSALELSELIETTPAQARAEASVIRNEVARCKHILQRLGARAGSEPGELPRRTSAGEMFALVRRDLAARAARLDSLDTQCEPTPSAA